MSEELRLFVLEDTENQIKIYEDAVEAFKKKKNIEVTVTYSKKLDDALAVIKTGDYDAAILDLKLGGDDTEGHGNKVIREIKSSLRFPIFVMSGFLDELDNDLREENIFYKTFKRTDKSTDDLLEDIYKIYSTGITKILGKKGLIDNALQKVFWTHFSKNESFWTDEFMGDKDCNKIFLRHILECLASYLESEFEKGRVFYHPAEVYIIPPVRTTFATGDILRKKDVPAESNKYYIILTPPCEMATLKTKFVALGYIEEICMPYVNEQKGLIKKGGGSDANQEDKDKCVDAKKKIDGLVRNAHSLKYHHLPKCESFCGGFINFQNIQSIKFNDLNNYEIVASITDSFVREIIARFSHYYARQGQPDFDFNKLAAALIDNGTI